MYFSDYAYTHINYLFPGTITVIAPLDYETFPTYQVLFSASDAEMSDALTVKITVEDANEPPTFDSLPASAPVAEDERTAVTVYVATATDVDEGDALTYEIAKTEPSEAPFVIDADTGKSRC